MEALTNNAVLQGSVVVIAVILILDRVVLLVKYARNGLNNKGVSAKSPTREIYVSQPMREVLQEMFKTQKSMQGSIDESNRIHKEAMGAMTNSLRELVKETKGISREVSEMKGKIG